MQKLEKFPDKGVCLYNQDLVDFLKKHGLKNVKGFNSEMYISWSFFPYKNLQGNCFYFLENTDYSVFKEYMYEIEDLKHFFEDKNIIKKDSYIVLNDDFYVSSFKNNHCYKQRENFKYLRPYVDSVGIKTNGFSFIDLTNFEKKWRYATKEEIKTYEIVGKPYNVKENVNILSINDSFKNLLNINSDFKAGDEVELLSDYGGHKAGTKTKINNIIINGGIYLNLFYYLSNEFCYVAPTQIKKVSQEINYVKCVSVANKWIARFTMNKIYKKNDWSSEKSINLVDDNNKSISVDYEGISLAFEPSTKEKYEAQNNALVTLKPNCYYSIDVNNNGSKYKVYIFNLASYKKDCLRIGGYRKEFSTYYNDYIKPFNWYINHLILNNFKEVSETEAKDWEVNVKEAFKRDLGFYAQIENITKLYDVKIIEENSFKNRYVTLEKQKLPKLWNFPPDFLKKPLTSINLFPIELYSSKKSNLLNTKVETVNVTKVELYVAKDNKLL